MYWTLSNLCEGAESAVQIEQIPKQRLVNVGGVAGCEANRAPAETLVEQNYRGSSVLPLNLQLGGTIAELARQINFDTICGVGRVHQHCLPSQEPAVLG